MKMMGWWWYFGEGEGFGGIFGVCGWFNGVEGGRS